MEWTEKRVQLAGAQGAPARSVTARTDDGHQLTAALWGSFLDAAQPPVVELVATPAPVEGDQEPPPPRLPTIPELQGALDQLGPPGSVWGLALSSNGGDAEYPIPQLFTTVRVSCLGLPQSQAGGLIHGN